MNQLVYLPIMGIGRGIIIIGRGIIGRGIIGGGIVGRGIIGRGIVARGITILNALVKFLSQFKVSPIAAK